MKVTVAPFFKAFAFALCYGIAFYLLQFFFSDTTMLGMRPTELNLMSWDAAFYESIAKGGYGSRQANTGFFILFPLLWKLSGLGVWGICAFNLLCFASGFAFLSLALALEDKVVYLLWLTLPPVYFAFLPYSESLFFLLGAIILYAVKHEKPVLLWISLFLISLVRATGIFLIPAFIAMELLGNPGRRWLRSIATACYRHGLPMLLALALFVYWQYPETGTWFIYFKTQASVWGHTFSWPGTPFTNIEHGIVRYHWLSTLAVVIDAFAFIYFVRQFIVWCKNKAPQDKALTLSVTYLAMVLLSLLFLNPKYGNKTTNIMGANRYTFMSPFFFLVLHYLYTIKYTSRQILYVFLFLNAFLLLFGVYQDFTLWYGIAMINNGIILSFMCWRSNEQYSWLALPIMAFNFFIQIHLFQQFITPLYVD